MIRWSHLPRSCSLESLTHLGRLLRFMQGHRNWLELSEYQTQSVYPHEGGRASVQLAKDQEASLSNRGFFPCSSFLHRTNRLMLERQISLNPSQREHTQKKWLQPNIRGKWLRDVHGALRAGAGQWAPSMLVKGKRQRLRWVLKNE